MNSRQIQITKWLNYVSKKYPDKNTWEIFVKLREGFKKNKNGWIYPSRLAGWGQQGAKIHQKTIIAETALNNLNSYLK